jgi:hypothetical protein
VPLRWSSRHGAPPGTTGSTIDDPSWSLTSPPFFFPTNHGQRLTADSAATSLYWMRPACLNRHLRASLL